jgi:ammonia channel protein AmtB
VCVLCRQWCSFLFGPRWYTILLRIGRGQLVVGCTISRVLERFTLLLLARLVVSKNFVWIEACSFVIARKAYDFAGGGPVHIASGFAGLAFCLVGFIRFPVLKFALLSYLQFVGPRKHVKDHVPHNLLSVFIATGLLWFGWLAFNGGSNVAPTARAALATFNSMLAPSVSALTWTFIGKYLMYYCGAHH